MTSRGSARSMEGDFFSDRTRERDVAEAAQKHLAVEQKPAEQQHFPVEELTVEVLVENTAEVDNTADAALEGASPKSALSARDQQILALERQWWKYAGAKEQAVRELFDVSATHYYQMLNALIDTEEALAHDPMLVKRLRRLRTSRQRARTARRLGPSA